MRSATRRRCGRAVRRVVAHRRGSPLRRCGSRARRSRRLRRDRRRGRRRRALRSPRSASARASARRPRVTRADRRTPRTRRARRRRRLSRSRVVVVVIGAPSAEHGLGLGDERDALVVRVADVGLHDDRRAADVQRRAVVATTSPSRTPRKKLVFDSIVDVDAPSGRLRNAHTAPTLSARVISAPPWSSAADRAALGGPGQPAPHRRPSARSSSMPVATAKGMLATSASRSMAVSVLARSAAGPFPRR